MAHYWEKIAALKNSYNGKPAFMKPGYTGKGADGKLQANMPAAIDMSSGSPIVIHEGEEVKETAMGRQVIPAKMVPLNSEKEQMEAARLEKEMGLPGMQTGGLIPNNEQFGMSASNNTIKPPTTLAPPNQSRSTQQSQPTTLPQFTPPVSRNTDPTTASAVSAGGVNTLASQRQGNVMAGVQTNPLAGKPIGMQTLQGIATGETDLYKGIYDKINKEQQGRLGAAQAAEKAAAQQSNAQAGVSQARANVLGAAQDRTQAIERGTVAQELGKQQMQQQAQAQEKAIQDVIKGKKEAIQDLVSLGGVDNLKQAEEYAKEVYGTDVYGLGNIANDQKMTAIAKYTAIPGMSVDGAMELMKQNGDFDMYGMTEDEARDITKKLILGTDPIYQAQKHYGDLKDQGLISNDEYNDAVDFVKWAQLNPEGVEIVDSFKVTDAEGREVGNFKTQEEANMFMQNNPGDFSVNVVPNGYIGYKGDYNQYIPVGANQVWEGEDGGLYMNVDGQKVSATPVYEDPFAIQNQTILNYYTAAGIDNDTTRSIRTMQLRAAKNDPESVPVGIQPESTLYQDLVRTSKQTSWDALKQQSEQGTGNDSHVFNPVLDQMQDNSYINVDGELWMLKNNQYNDQSGDNTHTYTLYNPSTGAQKTINTTNQKNESAVVTDIETGILYGDDPLKSLANAFLNPFGSPIETSKGLKSASAAL